MNTRDDAAWFRQPVVWLGALILAASIVGCVVMVVVALWFPDPPVDVDGDRTMNLPRHSAESTPAPPREAR